MSVSEKLQSLLGEVESLQKSLDQSRAENATLRMLVRALRDVNADLDGKSSVAWTKCSDMLPPEGQQVFVVYCGFVEPEVAVGCLRVAGHGRYRWEVEYLDDHANLDEVSHWMEPPQWEP
jgi:hypothetical protein